MSSSCTHSTNYQLKSVSQKLSEISSIWWWSDSIAKHCQFSFLMSCCSFKEHLRILKFKQVIQSVPSNFSTATTLSHILSVQSLWTPTPVDWPGTKLNGKAKSLKSYLRTPLDSKAYKFSLIWQKEWWLMSLIGYREWQIDLKNAKRLTKLCVLLLSG